MHRTTEARLGSPTVKIQVCHLTPKCAAIELHRVGQSTSQPIWAPILEPRSLVSGATKQRYLRFRVIEGDFSSNTSTP
eukprot:6481087-Amphidinium_carterae.1